MKRRRSLLEIGLSRQLSRAGVPAPHCEHMFHPERRWRFDFAWPDRHVAVEIQGGGFSGGRHTRGVGLRSDCEKQCEAVLLGWRVLTVTGDHVRSGQALQWVRAALEDQ